MPGVDGMRMVVTLTCAGDCHEDVTDMPDMPDMPDDADTWRYDP